MTGKVTHTAARVAMAQPHMQFAADGTQASAGKREGEGAAA